MASHCWGLREATGALKTAITMCAIAPMTRTAVRCAIPTARRSWQLCGQWRVSWQNRTSIARTAHVSVPLRRSTDSVQRIAIKRSVGSCRRRRAVDCKRRLLPPVASASMGGACPQTAQNRASHLHPLPKPLCVRSFSLHVSRFSPSSLRMTEPCLNHRTSDFPLAAPLLPCYPDSK